MIDAAAPPPVFAAPVFAARVFAAQDLARADAAAKEFEAVFIAQMLEPLFASVKTPAIAGGGDSEAFFKSLLQESYAKSFAERGGFGLAAQVKAALLDIQARVSAPPAENRP